MNANTEKKKSSFRDRMWDTLNYIQEHEDEKCDLALLADRLSYSPNEFYWLTDIFFEMPLDHIKKSSFILAREEDGELPFERHIDRTSFTWKYVRREELSLLAEPITSGESVRENTLRTAMRYVEGKAEEALEAREQCGEYILFWWHDASYKFHYLAGQEVEDAQETESGICVKMPASDYVMFTMREGGSGQRLEDSLKMLFKYAIADWEIETGKVYDNRKYYFVGYKDGRYHVFFPVQGVMEGATKLQKGKKHQKIYGIEDWTRYIDAHIKENLTVDSLAREFHYSASHFRHVFQIYYAISVNDYIRKRKVQCAADAIRAGKKPSAAAAEYGFKSRDGFNRAFKKEFSMSPSQYKKGRFEVVDLRKYYSEFKGAMKISYLRIDELKMIGHTVIPDRGNDVDIPAQISYWVDKDFPSVRTMRLQNNTEIREDKIAMWYHDAECINIEYILGPVVSDFENVPDDMVQVTISAGEYIVFESNKESDREDLAETIRMFSRCVFYGWIKEHRSEVDFNRFTFERYINDKAYIYVPKK